MRKAIVALAVLCAACGGNKQQARVPVATTAAPVTGPQHCADRTPAAPAAESWAGVTKPDVKVPAGPPPCKLVIQDIHSGTGAEAKTGSTVTVQYVGVSWSTGQKFDSSWDRGHPATFPLAQVIHGWQQGIPGMKEGGRRRLTIPPDLAYGQQGGPGIAPGETLVFVIDLIKVA
jgi:peptidylprolyl isomerase